MDTHGPLAGFDITGKDFFCIYVLSPAEHITGNDELPGYYGRDLESVLCQEYRRITTPTVEYDCWGEGVLMVSYLEFPPCSLLV